jgi:hypothetical protein
MTNEEYLYALKTLYVPPNSRTTAGEVLNGPSAAPQSLCLRLLPFGSARRVWVLEFLQNLRGQQCDGCGERLLGVPPSSADQKIDGRSAPARSNKDQTSSK